NLSIDDISKEDKECNSISFKIMTPNDGFTANLSVLQNYVTPKCVSLNEESEDDSVWEDRNCAVETYSNSSVRCACTSTFGGSFTLHRDEYELDFLFLSETDSLGLTGTNLADHPTALIVMIFMLFIYGLGFYWIEDHDENMHIPLLARKDVVFRASRDAYFSKSSLGKI
ncbi:MAG: hypothetical protein GY816_17640, partial [Cytophagales bacterium]|nr:hypothetical protein [Cytophagales bacterium]